MPEGVAGPSPRVERVVPAGGRPWQDRVAVTEPDDLDDDPPGDDEDDPRGWDGLDDEAPQSLPPGAGSPSGRRVPRTEPPPSNQRFPRTRGALAQGLRAVRLLAAEPGRGPGLRLLLEDLLPRHPEHALHAEAEQALQHLPRA